MDPSLNDDRRLVCPDCGASDIVAWASNRQPSLPWVYTCPKCKASHKVRFATPPPVQPTDPAAKMVEEKAA